MKLLRFFRSRVFLTALLILIQLAWLVLTFGQLVTHIVWISTAFTILSLLMVLYIIKKDVNPAYKIVWILIMLLLPLFGGMMYLLAGNKRPAQRLRAQLERSYALSTPLLRQEPSVSHRLAQKNRRMYGLSNYIASKGRFPAWENTATRYFPSGESLYAEMLRQLESAECFIFMEYFIIGRGKMWDGIVEVLARKAAAGVDVRLIYDDMGSLAIEPKKFVSELAQKGIRAMPFNPLVPLPSLAMNSRDHRKILVIDGHTAFTGGVNLADEYINAIVRFGYWKDTGVLVHGEAAWNFTTMFLEMWNAFLPTEDSFEAFLPRPDRLLPRADDGFVQPFGDSPLDSEPISENVYMDILAQACGYAYIFTPYLVIDSEIQRALCMAAKRGVDVRVVTPGIPDKKIVYRLTRSYYEPLLRAGVRIYEFTPGFLHAKCLVSDDDKAVVGSINMDFRSLYLHFECGALLYGTRSVLEVKQDMLDTFAQCREVHLEDKHWNFFGSLVDAILRVFAPLL